jgi:FkbM family methyltransferase
MKASGVGRARAALQEMRSRRVRRRLSGPKLLREFAEVYPEAFFIEIGSNDGDQHDHLRDFNQSRSGSGLMVEPVPNVFERLLTHYGDADGVILENAAIADRDGELPFFHLGEAAPGERDSMPSWYDAVGSFSRETILDHARHIPDLADRIVETKVPSLTLASLCRKHEVDSVDLILIDTEGYDYELIKTIDFEAQHPRLLIYEHFHLSPADRAEAQEMLASHGYQAMEEGFDTWCLDTAPKDSLTDRWMRTRPAVAGVSFHDEGA